MGKYKIEVGFEFESETHKGVNEIINDVEKYIMNNEKVIQITCASYKKEL